MFYSFEFITWINPHKKITGARRSLLENPNTVFVDQRGITDSVVIIL
jgi:hypothetical protein